MSNSAQLKLTSIEVAITFALVLLALIWALSYFAHLELRTCFAIASFFTATTQNLLSRVSLRTKVYRGVWIVATVLLVYFVWSVWR